MYIVGKTRAATLILFVATLLGACASHPDKDRPTIGCMQCGEIVDIHPAGATRTAGPAPGSAAPSARVLQPTRGLGLNAPGIGGANSPLGASTGEVPVYRVNDMSRLTRRAEVVLQMDDGSMETLLVENAHTLQVGDRVRRVGNRLMPEAAPADSK